MATFSCILTVIRILQLHRYPHKMSAVFAENCSTGVRNLLKTIRMFSAHSYAIAETSVLLNTYSSKYYNKHLTM
jgi:hypothetical protein